MRTLILSAALVAACSTTPNYYYAPQQAQVVRGGMPAHVEKIPSEAPQGTIEVSTVGIAQGQRGERALHVRLAVANEGDEAPWTLDIRQQQVDVPGAGRAQPQSANAGDAALPTISVPRRERRVIDLYYPLPPGVTSADALAGFDVLWQVATAAREVSGRTHIDRREVIERPTTYIASGWGPHWWYDPFWPRVHYRAVHVAPRHIHVRR